MRRWTFGHGNPHDCAECWQQQLQWLLHELFTRNCPPQIAERWLECAAELRQQIHGEVP